MKYLLILYLLNKGLSQSPVLVKSFEDAKSCTAFLNLPETISTYDVKGARVFQGGELAEAKVSVIMKKDKIDVEVLDRVDLKW